MPVVEVTVTADALWLVPVDGMCGRVRAPDAAAPDAVAPGWATRRMCDRANHWGRHW